MEIKLDSLISYEQLSSDVDSVLSAVEKDGKVVILRNNKPAYILMKYDANVKTPEVENERTQNIITLHEAMKIVLEETEGHKLHAAKLAEEIFRRGLYFKKDGTKAEYTQIRARCGHNPDLFETLPGNIIKLRDGVNDGK